VEKRRAARRFSSCLAKIHHSFGLVHCTSVNPAMLIGCRVVKRIEGKARERREEGNDYATALRNALIIFISLNMVPHLNKTELNNEQNYQMSSQAGQ
jgi:hypothetical protein